MPPRPGFDLELTLLIGFRVKVHLSILPERSITIQALIQWESKKCTVQQKLKILVLS